MDVRQIRFGRPDKDGTRRGTLLSQPDSIPQIVKINIEELPDDEDVDNGRFGADPPKMVAAMYAGEVSDPNLGPSYFGDKRPYSSQSSQGKHALDSVPEPGKWRARDQNKLDIDIRSMTTLRNA